MPKKICCCKAWFLTYSSLSNMGSNGSLPEMYIKKVQTLFCPLQVTSLTSQIISFGTNAFQISIHEDILIFISCSFKFKQRVSAKNSGFNFFSSQIFSFQVCASLNVFFTIVNNVYKYLCQYLAPQYLFFCMSFGAFNFFAF